VKSISGQILENIMKVNIYYIDLGDSKMILFINHNSNQNNIDSIQEYFYIIVKKKNIFKKCTSFKLYNIFMEFCKFFIFNLLYLSIVEEISFMNNLL
jgi:hypothetical protein